MDHFALQFCSKERPPLSAVAELVDRICSAFRRSEESFPNTLITESHSVWKEDGWCGRQGPLLEALRSGSPAKVHGALSMFFLSPMAYGFALGADDYEAITANRERKLRYVREWIARLRAIAVTMGVANAPNPERQLPIEYAQSPEEILALISSIEVAAGVSMGFPPLMGAYGCGVEGRLPPIPFPALSYYLVAANSVDLLGSAPRQVVEFGGGFGGVAFYLAQHGLERYTCYDLPFACAVQAYFLGSAIGPDAIQLFGEPETAASRISIKPAGILLASPAPVHQLLLAQDSMVEVAECEATRYLSSLLAANQWCFLSIAPDFSGSTLSWDGTRVRDLIPSLGSHRLALRFAYPLRSGHMSEVYLRNQRLRHA